MNEIIRVENLTKDYKNNRGVFDLNFSIKSGEVFGFVGTNGSGKTTTIRHIMGFSKPDKGNCYVKDLNSWQNASEIKKYVEYIPGEIAFPDLPTGTEFLKNQAELLGLKDMTYANELIKKLQLDTAANLKRMSKGMKQKLGIVAAFLHDPAILILDEPTSGLDPLMQSRFVELIAEEKAKGKTILLSSHIFEEIERTCDRAGIIRAGKLVTVDAVEALRKRHMRSYQVTLATEEAAKAFATDFAGVCDGRTVTVVARQSLEDIFMHYYGGEKHGELDAL